jgi:hypothetical protein
MGESTEGEVGELSNATRHAVDDSYRWVMSFKDRCFNGF